MAPKERERLLEQFGADLPAVQPSMPRLDHEQLTRCVQNLKERERAVVVMTFYDEQTGRDVASFLGVSEANVRDPSSRDPTTTRLHGGCGMNCLNPIDAAVLADYWLAALTKPEEETAEEHLSRATNAECGFGK